MKVKALSLVAGAIALTLSATPFAVKAQPGFSSNRLVAQAQNPQTPKARKNAIWEQLGLTDSQKSQIEAIRRDTRTQMERVLTQEQKNQIQAQLQARQAGQQSGQRSKKGFRGLNLTEAQKTQMKQIMESSQQKIQAVLTPAQQQKFQELRQNQRSRWQQRRSNQGPQS
jgi:Spy/CpxP family protein refolding chaperone